MTNICKRLPRDATKEQRELAALVKRDTKRNVYAHNVERLLERREFVFANQSVHHENYGETPAEQFARMAEKSS